MYLCTKTTMKEPKVAQKSPYVLDIKPGKYAWCTCGLSEKQPYCDGKHKDSGFSPVIEVVTEDKTVAWCGCKQTSTPPFCDGTHTKL